MITIKTFVFSPLQENTYLLINEAKQCAIIDPGCYFDHEKEELSQYIEKEKLTPTLLLNTHCHLDHIFGNEFILSKYKLSTHAHQEDEELLKNSADQGKAFGLSVQTPPEIGTYIDQDDVIKFGDSELKVLHIPGHSPGGVSFYCASENFIITGDVLFYRSIGRTDLYKGDFKTLVQNIKEKIFALPDDTVVYPGHGQSTTVGSEKKNNMFLR